MSPIESVRCRGNRYDLLPGTFYHLTPRDDVGRILFWNARLGEGLFASSSDLAAVDGLGDVGTPYYFANRRNPKERLWETIREQEFPTLPTRMKALFLFDSLDAVRRAQRLWFPNDSRHVIETRVVISTKLHKADSRWLDTHASEWKSSARSYWSTKMTDEPMVEWIANGRVYFPHWKEPPFDQTAGNVTTTDPSAAAS